MSEVQVFISYAHVDRSDALYVRGVVDGATTTHLSRTKLLLDRAMAVAEDSYHDVARSHPEVDRYISPLASAAADFGRKLKDVAATSMETARQRNQQIPQLTDGEPKPPNSREVTLRSWMDEDIPAGADWNTTIQDAIKRSAVFVILVPQSVSISVAFEFGIAVTAKKPIIPIAREVADMRQYNVDDRQALGWPSQSAIWNNQLIGAIGAILMVERK